MDAELDEPVVLVLELDVADPHDWQLDPTLALMQTSPGQGQVKEPEDVVEAGTGGIELEV